MDVPSVGLAEAIDAVRAELLAAHQSGRDAGLRFSVGKVVIEFAGELRHTVGVSAGVKFLVFSGDAKGDRSSSATQKVSVELVPTSNDFQIGDESSGPPTRR